MTSYHSWSQGMYPWDLAKCGCCMLMHADVVENVSKFCKDQAAHEEMRDVITEQGLGQFYKARITDWRNGHRDESPLASKWLNDNLERAVAIRELFRDHYAYNPAPPEQMELAFEPVAAREV